jgi:hypothetical protein
VAEPSRNLPALLNDESLLEALAAAEHERWSHWQRYLHAQCEPGEDGSLIIPRELVARWTHQMSTPYAELSEKEKDSDREQVREYLSVLAWAFEREDRA